MKNRKNKPLKEIQLKVTSYHSIKTDYFFNPGRRHCILPEKNKLTAFSPKQSQQHYISLYIHWSLCLEWTFNFLNVLFHLISIIMKKWSSAFYKAGSQYLWHKNVSLLTISIYFWLQKQNKVKFKLPLQWRDYLSILQIICRKRTCMT